MSEREDRRRARLRWITLGELLAVAAVLISALTLWNSYQERAHSEAERIADTHQATTRARVLVLRATVARDGDQLAIAPLATDQAILGQTIAFPAALGVTPVETTSDARIETRWFADALKKARDKTDKPVLGDLRLPVTITTRYVAGDATLTDTAVYRIGYVLEGHFLGGASIRLKGLSLVRHADAGAAQKSIDADWKG